MALVQRLLNFQFILGTGTFGETGKNTVSLSGLRASAMIDQAGGPSMGRASVKIYGMAQQMMNQLSTLGQIATSVRRNSIAILAGDAGGSMATIFTGTIQNGYGGYSGMPDVPFIVDAFAGFADAIKPNPPSNFVGSSDVATMLGGLATAMGLTFENNGVTAKLSNAYYSGAAFRQARQIVEDAGIEWNSCSDGLTLSIWNPGQARNTTVPMIAAPPTGGMIGYPAFFSLGIEVKTVFDPAIIFGGKVNVQSSLKAACGNWVVCHLTHNLETLVPHGRWETSIQGAPIGLGPVVPS